MAPDGRRVVMLSTALSTRGGVSSVVDSYRRLGLFDRWCVTHIATHEDGGAARKLRAAARAFARFVFLLARGKVSLVHVHSASNASFWRKTVFILAARAAGKPVIFHLHGGGFVDFYARPRGALRRPLIRGVLACAAEIVVLSDEWRRRVAALGVNPNITVIPNPVAVDAGPWDESRYCGGTILFVGRVTRDKGVFELVRAVARVARRFPRVRLELAGDGDLARIERLAREAGVADRVAFLGWIEGDAKRRAFARAAVFALPSYVEGLPMALLEAMAAGLPVVATRVGGVPGVVQHGQNGVLVEPRNADQLARALAHLLEDPARCRTMGAASRRKALHDFEPAKVADQLDALYRRHGLQPAAGTRPTLA